MAILTAQPHLQHMLHTSVLGEMPTEDITYPVISEFIYLHKTPFDRFAIYPQINLRWKPEQPNDTRAEVADFAIGNFSLDPPYFKIRVGAEAKRSVPAIMNSFPDPLLIENHADLMIEFHDLYYQGEDQAKAAIKGGKTFSNTIPYLLFVGPYWTNVTYGPFNSAQLDIRTHKPSDSGDFREAARAATKLASPPIFRKLYLLGTDKSHTKLEDIIASTDVAFSALRDEASKFTVRV